MDSTDRFETILELTWMNSTVVINERIDAQEEVNQIDEYRPNGLRWRPRLAQWHAHRAKLSNVDLG